MNRDDMINIDIKLKELDKDARALSEGLDRLMDLNQEFIDALDETLKRFEEESK